LAASAKLLDDAYRTEKNADVRERLLLVRRVKVNNKKADSVAEKELYRCRWWLTNGSRGLINRVWRD
jgi:hypothetical protein